MVHIETDGYVERSVAQVFAYATDYRRMPEWVFGITTVEPVGEPDHGPGASFQGAVDLGPKTLSSTAQITGWEQDRLVTLESVSGFPFAVTLTLTPVAADKTHLNFELTFATSGGVAGKAFSRTLEPLLALAARATTTKLCNACQRATMPGTAAHDITETIGSERSDPTAT
ncbi:SRPBCC family protein [Hoyosella subflava]|uniref:Polyketide cyclase/dehydrase n=1 Tax=Hoyosella subflava (strain DSM 45089 / JCM 17490 / NBRC 109087 / DQS3-9A1) TaxID=443218 RepID=F6ERP6_HOYSD|nr:SRPBCC family protein [Hoyosella subflava]AEF39623.1 hypothetical protein AS9A_1171 [Hoyosella subflava DQS3-9A1]